MDTVFTIPVNSQPDQYEHDVLIKELVNFFNESEEVYDDVIPNLLEACIVSVVDPLLLTTPTKIRSLTQTVYQLMEDNRESDEDYFYFKFDREEIVTLFVLLNALSKSIYTLDSSKHFNLRNTQ